MLDYLRCTWGKPYRFRIEKWIAERIGFDVYAGEILERGKMGYDRGVRTKFGECYWHETEDTMGICYQISGQGLSSLFSDGQNEIDLLRQLQGNGVRFKRLDYAFDVLEKPLATPANFYLALQSPDVNTKSLQTEFIRSEKPRIAGYGAADTCYLGSRKSDRFLRVYDKARQQKIMNTTWTRIEIELKGAKAASFANAALECQDCAAVARSEIAQMANFLEIDWFVEAQQGLQYRAEMPQKTASDPRDYFNHIMNWLRVKGHMLLPEQKQELAKFAVALVHARNPEALDNPFTDV